MLLLISFIRISASACKEITSGTPYVTVADPGCFIIRDILFSDLSANRPIVQIEGEYSVKPTVTIQSVTLYKCQSTDWCGCIHASNCPDLQITRLCVSSTSSPDWYVAYSESNYDSIVFTCNDTTFVDCSGGHWGICMVQGISGTTTPSTAKFSSVNATKCTTLKDQSRSENFNYGLFLTHSIDTGSFEMITVVQSDCGNVFSLRNKGSLLIEQTNVVDNKGIDIIQSSVAELTWTDSVFIHNIFTSFFCSEPNQYLPTKYKMTLSNCVFATGDDLKETEGLTTSEISFEKSPKTHELIGLNTLHCEYAPQPQPSFEPTDEPSESDSQSWYDPTETSTPEKQPGGGLSPGAIGGIAIGVVIGVGALAGIVVFFICRHRSKSESKSYEPVQM